jgi:hypothetical protein
MPQYLVLDPNFEAGTMLVRERAGVATRASVSVRARILHEPAGTE